MASVATSLFPVPDSQIMQVIFVRLPDGTIVPRAPHEVAVLPPDGSLGTPLPSAKA